LPSNRLAITAVEVCRIILHDTLGGLVAQATSIDFDQSGPITLRDLHEAIHELAGAKGWTTLLKKRAPNPGTTAGCPPWVTWRRHLGVPQVLDPEISQICLISAEAVADDLVSLRDSLRSGNLGLSFVMPTINCGLCHRDYSAGGSGDENTNGCWA
jgi:hypothetical protein